MTEQEYDEQIAPALAEIAKKIGDMGGSIVARVEWQGGESGITILGVTEQSDVGQRLTQIAALCNGNFDQLYMTASRKFDMSQTIVGRFMSRFPI